MPEHLAPRPALRGRRLWQAPRMLRELKTLGAVARTGFLRPVRPDRMVRMMREAQKWGLTVAAGTAMSAARYPDGTAIIDERGLLTWEELDHRTTTLARRLGEAGVGT